MDTSAIERAVDALIPVVTTYGLRTLGAIAILLAGKIGARIGGRLVRKALERAKTDPAVVGFAANMSYYAIITFAVVAAMSTFGIQTTSFIAVLGAAGLAVGLALQGSLSNFAAGVLILIFRPFGIGDLVRVSGQLGTVHEIGIFTTTLHSLDNQRIIVPNSEVMGTTIVNVNANDTRRVDLTAGIAYHDDIGKAKTVLDGILENHPKVLADPEPTVQVVELGDSSVNFVVRPWVKTEDYWDVYFDVTRAIKEEFDAAGISIPFPQQDVHLYREAAG